MTIAFDPGLVPASTPSVAPVAPAAIAAGRGARRLGWTLSGLFIAFMVFDGVVKNVEMGIVQETMTGMGWSAPDALWRGLGMLALLLTALHAWRPTAVLGAVLLTGYLGGAVVTQLRAGMPMGTHVLFGVYLGALMWGGLWLREPALRALLPLRR